MLKEYFNSLADELWAKSQSASFGGHRSDSGSNREDLLVEILRNHLPYTLTPMKGGTVVNLKGELSKQISVKSSLDKSALEDSIENVASVPGFSNETLSLTNSSIVRPGLRERFASRWPFRAVFAYEGADPETIYQHALAYYKRNSDRVHRFPEMIVVNKRLCIRYLAGGGMLDDGTKLPAKYMNPLRLTADTQGYPIAGIITLLNDYVPWMHYMQFNFSPYVDRAYGGTQAE